MTEPFIMPPPTGLVYVCDDASTIMPPLTRLKKSAVGMTVW
jgi:hypothetical protein